MTAVVLRPLGDATYAVLRGGVDTEVVVIATFLGWIVAESGVPTVGRRFARMSQAREWLDSPAGQDWLSSPAAAVPR